VYYRVFGLFKIAVIVQQMYARYKQGSTQDPRFASLGYFATMLAEVAGAALSRDACAWAPPHTRSRIDLAAPSKIDHAPHRPVLPVTDQAPADRRSKYHARMDSTSRSFGRWLLVPAVAVPFVAWAALLPACAEPCIDDGLGQTYCPPSQDTEAATGDTTGDGD